MTPSEIWQTLDVKLIAILRGITPDETPAIVTALLEEGVRAIEIPLNSPDPFTSIRIAAETARGAGTCLIGAGTVLSAGDAGRVQDAGGNLIVSPNVAPDVVGETRARGMASFPGVFTATEAHLAIRLGATGLKFFPASLLGAAGIKAVLATVPKTVPKTVQICAVGGVGPEDFTSYRAAGVHGFGLGSNLYRPGDTALDVRARAASATAAFARSGH